jgi:holo-[acyl-carrier protein] synthase
VNLRFGLDLVPVSTVADSIADQGRAYIERVYTASEIADSTGPRGTDPARFAERFAVKEATLKVLSKPDEGLDFRSIELSCDPVLGFRIALHGRAAELAAEDGIERLRVSVTRDDRLAAAVVAAELRTR